ncbi:MAG: response regulator [Candidatus Omnitrophota bacterium]
MEKKKILMIDDDQDFIKLVKMNLEETGRYEVRIEDKGETGVSSAIAFKPDIILLDVVLGDIDGSNVAAQIKNNKSVKDIPIVYVTAIINEKEEGKLHDFLGGYPFLAKPVSTAKLIECIETHIKN